MLCRLSLAVNVLLSSECSSGIIWCDYYSFALTGYIFGKKPHFYEEEIDAHFKLEELDAYSCETTENPQHKRQQLLANSSKIITIWEMENTEQNLQCRYTEGHRSLSYLGLLN